MAVNLQFATTVVAPTGTGLLYLPYGQNMDQVIWKNGTGATRSTLTLNRTRPKPTPSFPGVDRLDFKCNQFFTVGSTEYQAVIGLTASIPTVADATLRGDLFNRLILMAGVPTGSPTAWYDALVTDKFPT